MTPPRSAPPSVLIEDRPRLDSVGIVCPCGTALASLELVARACSGCGRIWLVSATLLRGPTTPETDFVYGANFDGLHLGLGKASSSEERCGNNGPSCRRVDCPWPEGPCAEELPE